jgi:DNA uptake protein ComE-like DNA-binding protein
MHLKSPIFLPVVLGLAMLSGLMTSCTGSGTPPSNQELQQKAAQTTERAKEDSKYALQNARIAAAKAESQVNAIASGVQQGIHGKAGDAPRLSSPVNLNIASESDLAQLPGISDEKAAQIIRHRPYTSAHQLVARGLLTQSQFDGISADVEVR